EASTSAISSTSFTDFTNYHMLFQQQSSAPPFFMNPLALNKDAAEFKTKLEALQLVSDDDLTSDTNSNSSEKPNNKLTKDGLCILIEE
ncbi:798_t:CDS:2, partial [Gigaspora margarita]